MSIFQNARVFSARDREPTRALNHSNSDFQNFSPELLRLFFHFSRDHSQFLKLFLRCRHASDDSRREISPRLCEAFRDSFLYLNGIILVKSYVPVCCLLPTLAEHVGAVLLLLAKVRLYLLLHLIYFEFKFSKSLHANAPTTFRSQSPKSGSHPLTFCLSPHGNFLP